MAADGPGHSPMRRACATVRGVITSTERSLTDDERRHLSVRLDAARAESARALVKTGAAGAAVCGTLAAVTLFASDAPRLVIVGFWGTLWAVLTLWIGLPQRRLMRGQIPVLEEARRTSRAREIRLQSTRVVEFEEEEDEGACYAFEHEPGSAVFIVGQEFYEDDDFPNSDFAMVEILGQRGQAVDVMLLKTGRKLVPERIVPAAVKDRLEVPDHLEVVPAPLDGIEAHLQRRGRH